MRRLPRRFALARAAWWTMREPWATRPKCRSGQHLASAPSKIHIGSGAFHRASTNRETFVVAEARLISLRLLLSGEDRLNGRVPFSSRNPHGCLVAGPRGDANPVRGR